MHRVGLYLTLESTVGGDPHSDTTCFQREDQVYHCIITMSLVVDDLPTQGMKVTCWAEDVQTSVWMVVGEWQYIHRHPYCNIFLMFSIL